MVMLISAKHEILNAHKYKNIAKFGIFPGSTKPRTLFRRLNAIMFYNVLKMSIINNWNNNQMFYLRCSLDVAYPASVGIYTLFSLASLTFH